MKTQTLIALASVVVLLSACIPSVNPYYTEKDVVFDPRLLGTWGDPGDSKESWRFEAADEKAYKFSVTEEGGKAGSFEARLFKLKGQLFLDIIPKEAELRDDQAGLVGASLIPGHLLIRIREIEPTLKADFFDWDWLKKHLENNPKALRHRKNGNDIVLLAEPRALQRFVMQHLKDGELFKVENAEAGMQRLTNAPAAPAK
jgi:hypothetical protein